MNRRYRHPGPLKQSNRLCWQTFHAMRRRIREELERGKRVNEGAGRRD